MARDRREILFEALLLLLSLELDGSNPHQDAIIACCRAELMRAVELE